MPPIDESPQELSLQEIVDQLDRYPADAFHFVQDGLSYAVEKVHGPGASQLRPDDSEELRASRHISGRQLCQTLREYALERWGFLAGVVLRRWQIHSTADFGKIVYAMIDGGLMQKTDEDTQDDFRDVFDFREAFERHYAIPTESAYGGCGDEEPPIEKQPKSGKASA